MIFKSLFSALQRPQLIGMVHLKALPGTPFYGGDFQRILTKALEETELLSQHVDGIIVENMFDVPYCKLVGPEIVSSMAVICNEVRRTFPVNKPVGVQILAGANFEAMSVAKAARLQFIRAENYVFAHVADEGIMPTASSGPLLRFRKQIDAEDIAVVADIKKKHCAHSLTTDVTIGEMAKAADFFAADGVILTGTSTGSSSDPKELNEVKREINDSNMAVLIGSGITPENAKEYKSADAFIVGSYLKRNGDWKQDLEMPRILAINKAVNELESL